MEEIEMPKITKFGGHTNAGLNEKSAGFVDTTASTLKTAKVRVEAPEPDDETEPPFNPADLSVADVNALQADCSDDEWALVLKAEQDGKARYGILGRPHGQDRT